MWPAEPWAAVLFSALVGPLGFLVNVSGGKMVELRVRAKLHAWKLNAGRLPQQECKELRWGSESSGAHLGGCGDICSSGDSRQTQTQAGSRERSIRVSQSRAQG